MRELRDIEAARERMRLGSYGMCLDCGSAVPYARLAVYPVAKRCLACQELQEKQYSRERS